MPKNLRLRRKRRARNEQRREKLLSAPTGPPRVRRTFFAKARSGDEVALSCTFSGVEVPFDPVAPDPGPDVERLHVAVTLWETAGHPTKGSE